MTRRALVLGVIGAILMAAWGQYVNKYVPGVMGLVRGHLPVSVFGLFIVFVMAINPLLRRIRPSLRLGASETALILAMILASCAITDAGLMRHFPRSLAFPIQQNRVHPGWQKAEVLSLTPPAMLANGGRYDETTIDAYFTGKGRPGDPIPVRDVPWAEWWKPLLLWGTLVALVFVAVVALSVVVHPQWAEKERIRYPLAEIGDSVLSQDEEGRPKLLRNRLFWVGLLLLLTVRALNGIRLWVPTSIDIPLSFNFAPIREQFPELMRVPGAENLAAVAIYPVCIGLAYLLASDIGFSLGISNLLSVGVLYVLITAGVSTSGGPMMGGVLQWQNFGSFLAMAAMLVYTGRRYYWVTARSALMLNRTSEANPTSVWAFRVLLVSLAGSVGLLAAMGLVWPIAAAAMASVALMFLVLARMNAETGTFFFAPVWQIPAVLVGGFGIVALGPKLVIILGLLMYMLTADPFECLMPFVSNGLKMTSQRGIAVGRAGMALIAGLLMALAVAIPTALWADYNKGVEVRRGSDTTNVYDAALEVSNRLGMSGELEAVATYSTWDRLRHIRPESGFLVSAGVGFCLVIGLSVLRLRCSWWPVHPVVVLVAGCGSMGRFCASFFLGWAIKATITRLGGAGKYVELKPLMLGVIVGDLLGSFLIMSSNWVYYLVTGLAGTNNQWVPW